jgi:hypothetical protein
MGGVDSIRIESSTDKTPLTPRLKADLENKLKAEDEDLKHLIVKLTNANLVLNKDLDTTQELQRKQAQAILDLKKGKKR